jgi:hypothetical protein
MKYNDSYLKVRTRLLKTEITIAGNEDIELLFRLSHERPIRQPAPPHLLYRSTVVTSERPAKPPVKTLINQNPHSRDGSNGFEDFELAGLNDGNCLLAPYRGEGIEEIFDRLTAFKVIDQVLQRDARADEHRRAAHDLCVGMDNPF